MTLDAPDGWTVDGDDPRAAELPTGKALSADWTVRVPSGAAPAVTT
ncbi:NEW3 domain-containing protein [Streptomyces thermocarboxydus]